MLKETRCWMRFYFAFASGVTFLVAIVMNYGSTSDLLFGAGLSILYGLFGVLYAYIAAKFDTLLSFTPKFITFVLKGNIGLQAIWCVFVSRDGLSIGPIIGTAIAVSFYLYLIKAVTRMLSEGV